MMHEDKIKYVTFTNKGYINYTANLISSIKQNKININLDVYCLDQDSFKYFSSTGLNTKLIDSSLYNQQFSKFEQQNSSEFYKIVYFKFFCINDLLKTSEYVLFLDGDIVAKKDFSKKVFDEINGFDIVAQSNKSPHDDNIDEINSGFILFKSSKKVLKYVNPDRFSLKKFSKFKFHDQTYLNNIKSKFNYKLLDLNDFPNGAHYKIYKNQIDPYIIHYNYILGHEKKSQMVSDGNWYL